MELTVHLQGLCDVRPAESSCASFLLWDRPGGLAYIQGVIHIHISFRQSHIPAAARGLLELHSEPVLLKTGGSKSATRARERERDEDREKIGCILFDEKTLTK